jgi:hypothetical protein
MAEEDAMVTKKKTFYKGVVSKTPNFISIGRNVSQCDGFKGMKSEH